jgi:hypothetical protein
MGGQAIGPYLDPHEHVYVLRVVTGDAEAFAALKKSHRNAPPTVTLTLMGTHGSPPMVSVPMSFIPHAEERFVLRLQDYCGDLRAIRVSIDNSMPGGTPSVFNWNLFSVTVTDMHQMLTWQATCRSVFSCTNSVAAALVSPTAQGRTSAYTILVVMASKLGHDHVARGTQHRRPARRKHSPMQVHLASADGESVGSVGRVMGTVSCIAVGTHTAAPTESGGLLNSTLGGRAVLRCPSAWLPHLGDKIEVGVSHCDSYDAVEPVRVSQVIVIRDGTAMYFRMDQEIRENTVHYGTEVEVELPPQIQTGGGGGESGSAVEPSNPLAAVATKGSPAGGRRTGDELPLWQDDEESVQSGARMIPRTDFKLHLHFDKTTLYSRIEVRDRSQALPLFIYPACATHGRARVCLF